MYATAELPVMLLRDLNAIIWVKYYKEAKTLDGYKIWFKSAGLLSVMEEVFVETPDGRTLTGMCYKNDSMFQRRQVAEDIINKDRKNRTNEI